MKQPEKDLPALQSAVELVNASSGVRVQDVARQLKLSQRYTKILLGSAKVHGLIGFRRSGKLYLWVPKRLEVAPKVESLDEADDEPDNLPPRWVPVSAPLPFVVRAPNSVFALGAK